MRHARGDYNRIQDPTGAIPYKEPVFLVRGQDKIAHLAVRFWAVVNYLTGGSSNASSIAWQHAKDMRRWPTKKSCDLPESFNTIKHYGDTTAMLHRLSDACSSVLYGSKVQWEYMDFDVFVRDIKHRLLLETTTEKPCKGFDSTEDALECGCGADCLSCTDDAFCPCLIHRLIPTDLTTHSEDDEYRGG